MKALSTLIRVHRQRLDEQGRVLRDLQALRAQIEGEIGRLTDELREEQESARDSNIASFGFAAYAARNREQRERLKGSLADLDGKIDAARDGLAAIFREVKTIENVQAGLDRRQAEKERRVEQNALDAIALGIHRRHQEGGRM